MNAKLAFFAALTGLLALATGGLADVPAPPVNQDLGMPDILFADLVEDDCRVCHDSGVQSRHHLLYGTAIPEDSFVPNPDSNGDGTPDATYGCLSCHDSSFSPARDCIVCHTSNAHHRTAAAASLDCVSCHGDIVDNIGDGHYIPTYPMSDITPKSSGGEGLPLNSRGNGAGACNYCHDRDNTADPIIRTTALLHHHTSDAIEGTLDCLVCHDVSDDSLNMRVCEGCHGPDSLHNIQADSPAPDNLGTIVVGGELAGYGHVGRDAGPGDSDCWGCHGFAGAASAPPSTGPIIPTVYGTDPVFMQAGSNSTILLQGASLVNTARGTLYESAVELTGLDGTTLTLEPDVILDEGNLVVTIPGNTSTGNYRVRAVKDEFASNPTAISVVPAVSIDSVATRRGRATIYGSGFAGYAPGSGTEVYATHVKRVGRRSQTYSAKGEVLSWHDTQIIVRFSDFPRTVTVHSVFGSDRYVLISE